jgi:predicted nucleic acid-binding protein
MAWYYDTSALAKLIMAEAETAAFQAWAAVHAQGAVTSAITSTELERAVRREAPERLSAVATVLSALHRLAVSSEILARAGELKPADVRTLDAIHLASALAVKADLEGVVTYDARMATAAQGLGLVVATPR